jgi:hypothetical protein
MEAIGRPKFHHARGYRSDQGKVRVKDGVGIPLFDIVTGEKATADYLEHEPLRVSMIKRFRH